MEIIGLVPEVIFSFSLLSQQPELTVSFYLEC